MILQISACSSKLFSVNFMLHLSDKYTVKIVYIKKNNNYNKLINHCNEYLLTEQFSLNKYEKGKKGGKRKNKILKA